MVMRKIGSKVKINCPEHKNEKCKANGHTVRITYVSELDEHSPFDFLGSNNEILYIYEIEWFPEDNPGQKQPNLAFDFYYWLEEDFVRAPINPHPEKGLPPC